MIIDQKQIELVKFKAVVLNHIKTSLGEANWQNLREYVANLCEYDKLYDANHTPEDIVELALIDNSVDIQDFLLPFGEKAVHIASVGDHRVFCVNQMGYYFIEDKDGPYVWSIDVTYPACHPPGW